MSQNPSIDRNRRFAGSESGDGPAVQRARRCRLANRRARCGVVFVSLLVLIGVLAPLLASGRPIVCRFQGRLLCPALADTLHRLPVVGRWVNVPRPFNQPGFDAKVSLDPAGFAVWPPIPFGPLELTDSALAGPSRTHWLGTDDRGRDVASRLIHGTSVSIRVGLLSIALAGLIGFVVGATAGYVGGWTDWMLSRLIEAVTCFPTFFLILAAMVWLAPSVNSVILVIGLTRWTTIARLARAEFLKLRTADFVLSAICAGASPPRIIVVHLLPAAMAPVLVTAVFGVADAILIEVGLSWLGFGAPAAEPSWGHLLRSAFDQLRSAGHLVYPPCAAILAAILSCHLLADGLSETWDPRTRAGA